MHDQDVIERLAAKLAAADLADDEVALLASLLAGSDEVSGYSMGAIAMPRSRDGWIEVIAANHTFRSPMLPPAIGTAGAQDGSGLDNANM